MIQGYKPASNWSLRSSAIDGSLVGLAVTSLHHVHHAITNNIPDNIYTHVIGEAAAGLIGGAILFVGVAAVRNWIVDTPGLPLKRSPSGKRSDDGSETIKVD